MAEPILYSFRRCPYAMRARLAISASGVRCQLREIKLRAKPAEMLEASPKGTVPVLVMPDGTVIDQSFDIMLWALQQNDPGNLLSRHDPNLIANNDGPFKKLLDGYKYPERLGTDADISRTKAMETLRELDARIASQGQLCGAEPGLSDLAIMPFVRQFAAVDQDWFASQPLQHLQQWLADHLASSLFASVMTRYAPWAPGDPAIFFPE